MPRNRNIFAPASEAEGTVIRAGRFRIASLRGSWSVTLSTRLRGASVEVPGATNAYKRWDAFGTKRVQWHSDFWVSAKMEAGQQKPGDSDGSKYVSELIHIPFGSWVRLVRIRDRGPRCTCNAYRFPHRRSSRCIAE